MVPVLLGPSTGRNTVERVEGRDASCALTGRAYGRGDEEALRMLFPIWALST